MNLHQLVIDMAAAEPDNLAVTDAGHAVTYRELDQHANTLAAVLRHNGVGHGDRVVLWAEKSVTTVAAMQAVLRLGAAYVPAETNTPIARVAAMARDCAASAVLTTPDLSGRIRTELEPSTVCLDFTDTDSRARSFHEPVAADDLAYILYTSGSTGRPKGVCVSHRNARAFVDWAASELQPLPADRFANHAPLTFDLSVLDLYAAFSGGACVCLIPSHLAYAPAQLVQLLHDQHISIWYSVPSALALMIREGGLLDRPAPATLRAVLFAGEPFAITHVRQLAGWTSARLLNLYGPTETNVCTYHELAAADLDRDRPVPIGTAACGDRVWAQNENGSVAGPGDEGELLVEGPTVMLGYWGRPRHQGPYCTGDLVRVLPDGGFDFVGRRDHMVKVRGHRVELGDIEAALTTHPDVAEAVAVVTGTGVDARLTAFVLPHPDRQPGTLALRQHCAQQLPRYMLVDHVRTVTELPRTRNGKIDRSALLAIAAPSHTAQGT
ncbi:amino acid adenylation domain-containing protein [Micromonospora sp. WMMC250]|uniref:amino acid adenylation domain-containing protein n=1 Tax=Micromonospora sp. WMMC250 TaxID=3014781 RepID=UPI0022B65E88|nr:amino acid adenylation domain-containing protein [Micromonospora sp. WMMC250]MCZ7373256.1 amino acid adenylation domain-containing protein [Micromonospora sp. WMMC250]MCZ7373295.1 amino acid adenylation domain-containing protein [Micromonospora sp. WMMC250]MCZ7379906.1 amino acid adenylation domain-containing protein [Micromonospora sp. WMMC250]